MLELELEHYFYRFFFTHLLQEVTNDGLVNWVELVQESLYDDAPADGLGQVFIKVSPSLRGSFSDAAQVSWATALQSDSPTVPTIPNQGELELVINKGKTTLDASYSIDVSMDLKIDTTLQPVQDYKLVWDSPIFEGRVRNHADFIWTQEIEVERQYPYVVGPQYTYKPWHFELDIEKKAEQVLTPTWQTLTVDSTSILISQTVLKDAYSISTSMTTDKTEYFANLVISSIDLELDKEDLPDSLLKVENLPQGDLFLTLKINGLNKSRTWRGWGGRGYTPASRIDDQMKGASLIDTAWSIFTLIDLKEDYLLILALAELSYIWANYLDNVSYEDGQVVLNPEVKAGFPDIIPRITEQYPDRCYLPPERSIKGNAWLGLALVQAAKHLCNRRHPTQLPPFFDLMLRQIGQLVAGSIDSVTGWAVAGYDEFGYALDFVDYPASVVGSLFLTELLSIQYNELVHKAAAVTYLALKDITSFSQLSSVEFYSNEQLVELHLYFLLWLDRLNKTEVIKPIAESYRLLQLITTRTAETNAISLYVINRLYRTSRLDSIFPISSWNPTVTTTKFDEGLYGVTNATPELITSSAVILNKNEASIFVEEESFNLYADEALALSSYSFQTARRLWPYGYQWLSPEAEEATTGEAGAILHAYSQQTFHQNLLTALLKKSSKITTAQGVALDTIAQGLLKARQGLQSDSYLRDLLLHTLNNERSTLESIKQWINFFYTSKFDLSEPLIKLSFYIPHATTPNAYVLTNSASIKEAVSYMKAIGENRADKLPGYYELRGSSYHFVSWYEVAARLNIYIYEYLPGFAEDMLSLKSAGIKVSTHLKLLWMSSVNSYIHDVQS